MKKMAQSYKTRRWTVARLAALLAAGLDGKNRPDLQKAKERYGVGLKEILWLQSSLFGMLEDVGVNGAMYLNLDIEPDERVPGKYLVTSIAPSALKRMTCLSQGDAMLAARALEGVAADKGLQTRLGSIAARVRKELGPEAEEAEGLMYYMPSDSSQIRTKVEALANAVAFRRQVEFNYHKPDSAGPESRLCWPLSVRRDQGAFRMAGWDPEKKGLRVFALDRLEALRVLAEGFEWPQAAEPAKIARMDLSLYRPSQEDAKVAIAMTARAFQKHFSPGQRPKAKPVKDGWVEFILLSGSPEWVARTFLPLMPEVKVKGPAKFKKAWDAAIRETLRRY